LRIHALAALAHPCAAQRRGNPALLDIANPSIEPTRISNQLNSACRLLCPPGCSNLVLPFLVAGNDYVSKPTAAGWRRLNACICRYGR